MTKAENHAADLELALYAAKEVYRQVVARRVREAERIIAELESAAKEARLDAAKKPRGKKP